MYIPFPPDNMWCEKGSWVTQMTEKAESNLSNAHRSWGKGKSQSKALCFVPLSGREIPEEQLLRSAVSWVLSLADSEGLVVKREKKPYLEYHKVPTGFPFKIFKNYSILWILFISSMQNFKTITMMLILQLCFLFESSYGSCFLGLPCNSLHCVM